MMLPLQASQAAPRLPWSEESSLKPTVPWCQGCFGELCRSENGTFNMLCCSCCLMRIRLSSAASIQLSVHEPWPAHRTAMRLPQGGRVGGRGTVRG